MPPRKEMTTDERSEAVGMWKAGKKMTQIAKALKRPLTTISNLVRRYKLNGHVHNMKREGRPRKATARDLRHLERVVKENRRKPAKNNST